MIVSLEAIFMSTFAFLSQNRLGEDVERRANVGLQIGLLTEPKVTRVLQMLDAIQDKIGVENDTDSELANLEMETRPVLAFLRSVYRLGVLGQEQVHYWKLLGWTIVCRPRLFPLAITLAIYGYHFRKICELQEL